MDKWGIAEVTFTYLNIISANNPYNHLAGYCTHKNKYINTISSTSIKN